MTPAFLRQKPLLQNQPEDGFGGVRLDDGRHFVALTSQNSPNPHRSSWLPKTPAIAGDPDRAELELCVDVASAWWAQTCR